MRFFNDSVHNAIIIDDTCLKSLNREQLIKLFDSESESTFNVKHSSVRIPENIPRYFCSNLNLADAISVPLEKAIERRVQMINIEDRKLYICKKSQTVREEF